MAYISLVSDVTHVRCRILHVVIRF